MCGADGGGGDSQVAWGSRACRHGCLCVSSSAPGAGSRGGTRATAPPPSPTGPRAGTVASAPGTSVSSPTNGPNRPLPRPPLLRLSLPACLPFLLLSMEMGVPLPPELRHRVPGPALAGSTCCSCAAWPPSPASPPASALPPPHTLPAPAPPIAAPCLAPLGPSGSPVSLTQVSTVAGGLTGPGSAEGPGAAWGWGLAVGVGWEGLASMQTLQAARGPGWVGHGSPPAGLFTLSLP